MTKRGPSIQFPAFLLATALATGCGDGAVEPPPPPTPVPTTITVSPASATLQSVGETTQLTAEVRDQHGQAMANAAVAWTSGDPSVATVAAGLVTAVANGTATVTATAGLASGTAAVTVDQVVAAVAMDPAAATLLALGDTLRLSAEAQDANGNAVAGTELAWASEDTLVAVVDQQGLATAVANGTVMVTATAGAVSASAEVTVDQVAVEVVVEPAKDTLVAFGDTLRLSAEAVDANGNPVSAQEFAWTSGDTLVAVVDQEGRVRGVSAGEAEITAALADVTGRAQVIVVLPVPTTVVVNRDAVALIGIGRTARLAAEVRHQAGRVMKGATVSWSSGDTLVATVDPTGLVTATGIGVATITAKAGSASGRAVVTVRLPLSDRAVLVTLYNATDGPNWVNSENWLSDAPLGEWYGVGTDGSGRVLSLDLSGRAVAGSYVPHGLAGSLPPELGELASLQELNLAINHLSGAIPPELGNLAKLRRLTLWHNDLTGEIPSELSKLRNLGRLGLNYNSLSGAIPPELGDLISLEDLLLTHNRLSGSVPAQLGRLWSLQRLELSHNDELTGRLPTSLTDLHLRSLQTAGTGLCAPSDAPFQDWLRTIASQSVASCGDLAYLVQAVQSLTDRVPLVAGEKALLRVFVTAQESTSARIPPARARFFVDGAERHVVDIPAGSTAIPTGVEEGDLSKSANAEVSASNVRPGLEMVIEIDPEGTLDPGLDVPKRIPEMGRIAVEVRETPVLDLTVIPFLWEANPNYTVVGVTKGMQDNPYQHYLLEDTRILLPVRDLNVTAHDPVVSTSNNAFDLLQQTRAVRALEGGEGYYMGMMSGPVTGGVGGVASGRSNFSTLSSSVIAHELGHNMSLAHAPCGDPEKLDPLFPGATGQIGAWGYDFRDERLVPPDHKDLMSYCGPEWISGYHFKKALAHRLAVEASAVGAATTPTRSLLIWGGVDREGKLVLHPSFVADAPPALPASTGDHILTGQDADGGQLFSVSFAMPEVADADGRSSFAFMLPVRPGWAGALASITLSGPDDSVTLDDTTDRPMAILRDSQTGQVRAFLRNLPQTAAQAAMDALEQASGRSLEVLFSRGIPDPSAWRQ